MPNGRCYQRRTNNFDAKIKKEHKLVMSCCFVGKYTKRQEEEKKKAIRARILISFSTQKTEHRTQNNVARYTHADMHETIEAKGLRPNLAMRCASLIRI